MIDIMQGVIILSLLGYIVFKELITERERKKLLEMIMSKSLVEFKSVERSEKNPPEPATHTDLTLLDSASDEQFMMAIKKDLGREPIIEKLKEKIKTKLKGQNG